MSGGGSFTSDQSVAHATGDGQMVATTRRARVTSIQAEGAASSSIILKSGGASGTVVATYKFGTEGLDMYIPGSGIFFAEGVYLDLTATPGVTITFT
jgi:imidazolonepropionase-like amidohydrolase|tara:strand:+ start:10 stop:300 length:291 start_codon:yes stop_codon:yes gene_type:complete